MLQSYLGRNKRAESKSLPIRWNHRSDGAALIGRGEGRSRKGKEEIVCLQEYAVRGKVGSGVYPTSGLQ